MSEAFRRPMERRIHAAESSLGRILSYAGERLLHPLRLFRAIACGILASDEAEAKKTEDTRQAARSWPATFHYVALV